MKKAILFFLIFLFAVFNWSVNPAMKQAEAITRLYLVSPADSTKMTESNPTFKWRIDKDIQAVVRKYYIALDTILTDPFKPTSPVWQDSTYETMKIDTNGATIDTTWVRPATSIDYDGPPLEEWETYFWSVRVQVDVWEKIVGTDTTWAARDQLYDFVRARTFFYTTATLIGIPDSLPTIQEGIIWAAAGDTILVEPGVYYENLRFYKDSVILASHFARDGDTTKINSTIIDGDSLTRKEENGSVIYFTSDVDSASWVIGFTIRNGKGTRAEVGVEEKVNGGGIFCDLGSTPTIAYNVIIHNHAPDDGGGIFCYSAAPNIFNNIIAHDSAGGSGGAIQCYSSIKTKPSLSSGPTGGKGEEDRESEIIPKPSFSSPRETEKTSPSPESNSKIKEDDLKNSLYPRDATEVFSALSSDPLAKPAQNHPPVAILEYHIRRDTIVQREKILVGDTIFLDGSKSYDPDSLGLEPDSVDFYQYKGSKWQSCEIPDDWRTWSGQAGSFLDTLAFPVEVEDGGRWRIWLIVRDTQRKQSAPSDTIYLNIQRAPRADAGDSVGIAPGDTAWLDGSGSCDINPDDTTLSYWWTQISGPVDTVDTLIDTTQTPPETTFVVDTLWVTLVDSTIIDTTYYSHPANPYFETDTFYYYLGGYQFQLVVCDSCDPYVDTVENIRIVDIDTTLTPPDTTFAYDTTFVSGCDTAIAVVNCSNPPVAVCPPDTFGFDVGEPIPLDGSASSDTDEVIGDYVRYFIWEGLTRITCKDTVPRSCCRDTVNFSSRMWNYPEIIVESTEEITYVEFKEGGIYELSLSVKDRYGTRSENTCTLKISVQLRPEADAGPDTIVRPKKYAYLHGDACEVNWDQVDFLQYEWRQDTSGGADKYALSDPYSQETRFGPLTKTGVYRLALRVTDPSGGSSASSRPDDTVRVIVNELPQIDGISPDPDDTTYAEGDMVELTVWAHDAADDVQFYGDNLTYKWTAIGPESYRPTIIDPTKPTMKFVPLKHGEYVFQVVVHDTISPKQYPSVAKGFNIDTVKITVDTTLAYPFIMGNLISSNTAGLKGGGINCIRSSPEIINNIFYKNKSGSSGGAICTQSSSAPYIKRNIFFGNISGDSTGGAIADLKVELSPSATIGFREKMEVATNDFWNNAGGNLYQPPADVSGNIYVYPRLVDPEYGNFRLECSSPCLNDSIGLLLWLYPDTCGTVPALSMISLSLFQNPVATAVAHFLVNTDVPLKTPPVAWVTFGEYSAVPIYFTHVFSTTYRGDFIFTNSGTAHITVFASSVLEQDTSITRDFAVQLIEAGKIGKLVSHDNQIGVLFPQGVAKGEIYATCIPVSDDPQYHLEDEDKVALGEAYHLGPLSDFKKELTISFPLDDYDLTEKDKTLFSIYRYEKNGWERKASFLDENSICAKVKELGVYRLVYDVNQEHITAIPKTYQLFQNYPNPFNPQTVIKYDLPKSGHVNVTVYNILGQKVKTLVDEQQEAGHQSVNWNGKDGKGENVASGIYFYKIKTVEFEKTKKMVLLK